MAGWLRQTTSSRILAALFILMWILALFFYWFYKRCIKQMPTNWWTSYDYFLDIASHHYNDVFYFCYSLPHIMKLWSVILQMCPKICSNKSVEFLGLYSLYSLRMASKRAFEHFEAKKKKLNLLLLIYTLRYSTLPYPTLCYYTLRYSTILYATLLYTALLYSTLFYCSLCYSTLLYSTLRYSTLLYATLRYATVLYATLR